MTSDSIQDEADYWLIRAGKHGELWDSWSNADIITVGWDIGRIAETEPRWDEMKDRIVSEYDPDDPGQVTGRVSRFAGLQCARSKSLKENDVVIVEGDATVAGIGIIGEYRYERGGLPEATSHAYWRDVRYLYDGPVRIRDLPTQFQQGGEYSLHLPETIQEYDVSDVGVLGELLSALSDAD